jgi:hypothetical protein
MSKVMIIGFAAVAAALIFTVGLPRSPRAAVVAQNSEPSTLISPVANEAPVDGQPLETPAVIAAPKAEAVPHKTVAFSAKLNCVPETRKHVAHKITKHRFAERSKLSAPVSLHASRNAHPPRNLLTDRQIADAHKDFGCSSLLCSRYVVIGTGY